MQSPPSSLGQFGAVWVDQAAARPTAPRVDPCRGGHYIPEAELAPEKTALKKGDDEAIEHRLQGLGDQGSQRSLARGAEAHRGRLCGNRRPGGLARSEEHTSELQSLMRISYAVFCLKKNTKETNDNHTEYK